MFGIRNRARRNPEEEHQSTEEDNPSHESESEQMVD